MYTQSGGMMMYTGDINYSTGLRGGVVKSVARQLLARESAFMTTYYAEKHMGIVIFLDIDKDTAMKRALSRVVCSKCGLSYNLDNKELSPIKEGICDACGGTLKTRGDDNKETFITRFDTYMKETYPLIEYYEKKNNLVKIEVSNLTADEVFEEVKKVIK